MRCQRTVLSAALTGALGMSALGIASEASAVSLVIDGMYELRILTTPTRTTYYGGTEFTPMTSGSLESSFTFGNLPGSAVSQGMTDNNVLVNVTNDWSTFYGASAAPGAKGNSVVDTYAGLITFDVVNGNIQNATSFNVDTIFGTPIGSIGQFLRDGDLSGFSGNIDAVGNMTFTPTNRLAAADGPTGGVIGRWVIDAATAPPSSGAPQGAGDFAWNSFTTASASAVNVGTLNGTACTGSAGTYNCTLVSGGNIGTYDWGSISGVGYFEVWKTELVRVGDAAIVPIPAALWLFGSGLLGLIGIASRRAL